MNCTICTWLDALEKRARDRIARNQEVSNSGATVEVIEMAMGEVYSAKHELANISTLQFEHYQRFHEVGEVDWPV